jgi:hypothetical protein
LIKVFAHPLHDGDRQLHNHPRLLRCGCALVLADVAIGVRVDQREHSDQHLDGLQRRRLRSSRLVEQQPNVPHVALSAEITDDVAGLGLILIGYDDRQQDSLDRLDGVVPSVAQIEEGRGSAVGQVHVSREHVQQARRAAEVAADLVADARDDAARADDRAARRCTSTPPTPACATRRNIASGAIHIRRPAMIVMLERTREPR